VGKMAGIIGGGIAILIGVILMFSWGLAFKLGIQFLIILILLFGGLIAVIAGVSELKDSAAAKKEEEKKEEENTEEEKEEVVKEEKREFKSFTQWLYEAILSLFSKLTEF